MKEMIPGTQAEYNSAENGAETIRSGHFEYEKNVLEEESLANVKPVLDALAPYLDHGVFVTFGEGAAHNPGLCSMMLPKFKDPGHQDRVWINRNFWDRSKITEYLIHELGHSFQYQLEAAAEKNKLALFPPDGDITTEYFKEYEIGELQADIFTGYILNPELMEKELDEPVALASLEATKKLLAGADFTGLRETIKRNDEDYKALAEKRYHEGGEKPAWLEEGYKDIPIYERALDADVNADYKRHVADLEKRFA